MTWKRQIKKKVKINIYLALISYHQPTNPLPTPTVVGVG